MSAPDGTTAWHARLRTVAAALPRRPLDTAVENARFAPRALPASWLRRARTTTAQAGSASRLPATVPSDRPTLVNASGAWLTRVPAG